ncbi:alpha/beta hydrolase [Williamsia muralis]|uniref:alpha/beta hydrolase n=1 Tax=Williamsia marianensis TaxID=85044 RepID=UPI0039EC5CDA
MSGSSPSAAPPVSRSQTIVLCPGLGGTQDSPVVQRAVKSFSTAGFNTFTFDYRSFGGSDGHPRQVASVTDQLHDIEAAVAAVSRQGTISVDQLVLWGTSLGVPT